MDRGLVVTKKNDGLSKWRFKTYGGIYNTNLDDFYTNISGYKVKLTNDKPFSGIGTVCEWLLFERGWNDAQEKEKVGVVQGIKTKGDFKMFDIYFPYFDVSYMLFADEFYFLDENGEVFSIENK